MRILFTFLLLISYQVNAGKDQAIALMNAGKYKEAVIELESLASDGDDVAMVTIGNLYYEGKTGRVKYKEAYEWWFKAYQAGNVDALSNIGVLYRDGKGVKENLEIAYDIFVIIHIKGMGNRSTQIRNGGNLNKTIAKLSQDRIKDALCYSEEYVSRYIETKGSQTKPTKQDEVKLKDKNWWLPGELPTYECTSGSSYNKIKRKTNLYHLSTMRAVYR
ncbi:MAG: tetratricopeptide repeat protein [Candidatus Thiodiazotropha endolucinida]